MYTFSWNAEWRKCSSEYWSTNALYINTPKCSIMVILRNRNVFQFSKKLQNSQLSRVEYVRGSMVMVDSKLSLNLSLCISLSKSVSGYRPPLSSSTNFSRHLILIRTCCRPNVVHPSFRWSPDSSCMSMQCPFLVHEMSCPTTVVLSSNVSFKTTSG